MNSELPINEHLSALISKQRKSHQFGHKSIWYDHCPSTNTIALKQAQKDSTPSGTTILTGKQTKGKGRSGNIWQEYEGMLATSIILKENINPQISYQLTLLTALAVLKTLQSLNLYFKVKWPNDIIIFTGKDYKKICGILIEAIYTNNNIDCIVIGIGLNVHKPTNKYPKTIENIAISLQECGCTIDKVELANLLLNHCEEIIHKYLLDNNYFSYCVEQINKNLAFYRQEILISSHKHERGQLLGLNSDGFLLLKDKKNQIQIINHGQIKHFAK